MNPLEEALAIQLERIERAKAAITATLARWEEMNDERPARPAERDG